MCSQQRRQPAYVRSFTPVPHAAIPPTFRPTRVPALLLKESDANFDDSGKAFADGEYGWAKLMGELQLQAFCKQKGISGVACRIFTAYGERENESHAVIALIAKAAARLDPFPIWGDGLQTRNFTYVQDTVTGLALSGAVLENFEVINVGADTHQPIILELLEEIFGFVVWRPKTIERQLDKPVGVKSRAADITQVPRTAGMRGSLMHPARGRRAYHRLVSKHLWSARCADHRTLADGAQLKVDGLEIEHVIFFRAQSGCRAVILRSARKGAAR